MGWEYGGSVKIRLCADWDCCYDDVVGWEWTSMSDWIFGGICRNWWGRPRNCGKEIGVVGIRVGEDGVRVS